MGLPKTVSLGTEETVHFNDKGYLLIENALSPDQLTSLRRDFDNWVEESREHTESYGEQLDGRPRFSLEPGHSADNPALRRIASPVELSDACLDVMRNTRAIDAVAQLIGPNIKFNNDKINFKHPGSGTEVKFHQDFLFEPHSNDDLITVLYFIDDLTPENGPLEIVPGSHKGPLYDHWHDGVFTGAVSKSVENQVKADAVPCYGTAGSACLMHTRLLHGSAPNHSSAPRTLYIVEYCAEDAYPLQANHIPSKFVGEVVRGEATNRVRCTDYEMAMPEYPKQASFFEQQAKSASS